MEILESEEKSASYKRCSLLLFGMLIYLSLLLMFSTQAASWFGDIMPLITDTYVFGNATFRWLNITTKFLHAENATLGNLTVSEDIEGKGDLDIAGNITGRGLVINLS